MIIRHDRSERDSLVDALQWPGFTTLFRGDGGATLIAQRWLLTAAHVADMIPREVRLSVELADKRYRVARTLLHPDYEREWTEGDENDGSTVVDQPLLSWKHL